MWERLIVVNRGEIAFDDTPKEVFSHYRELEAMGLAAPQITYIMHALKEKGLNVDPGATTVPEACEGYSESSAGSRFSSAERRARKMIRDITIGQYYPADSVLHRLDPRTKLAGTLIFIISVFLFHTLPGYAVATVFLAAG